MNVRHYLPQSVVKEYLISIGAQCQKVKPDRQHASTTFVEHLDGGCILYRLRGSGRRIARST
jgi:hypothetical protein